MLVEADRTSCLREVLVITAALSIQDPRERPTEQRQAADARHARFDQDGSDFVAFLKRFVEYLKVRPPGVSPHCMHDYTTKLTHVRRPACACCTSSPRRRCRSCST